MQLSAWHDESSRCLSALGIPAGGAISFHSCEKKWQKKSRAKGDTLLFRPSQSPRLRKDFSAAFARWRRQLPGAAVAGTAAGPPLRRRLAAVFPTGFRKGPAGPFRRCGVEMQREGHNRKCPSLCSLFAYFRAMPKVGRRRTAETFLRRGEPPRPQIPLAFPQKIR